MAMQAVEMAMQTVEMATQTVEMAMQKVEMAMHSTAVDATHLHGAPEGPHQPPAAQRGPLLELLWPTCLRKKTGTSLPAKLQFAATSARSKLLQLADMEKYGLERMQRFNIVPHFDFARQFVTIDTSIIDQWIRSVVKIKGIDSISMK